MRPLEEQRILVTGATDGLGRGLAEALAAAGAAVLIHGRCEQRGREMIERLRSETGNERLHWLRADLSSLYEVHGLACQLVAEFDELHALVNNAGIGSTVPGGGERMESRDGYELRFAVNYLAGYLLTRRLMPLLEQSGPARVINVSSAGQAPINFDDVMLERHYDPTQAYCQSKLAQVLFTFDLAEQLEGSGVTANCLHPGTYMPTKIVIEGGITPMTALEDGVKATMRLVADPDLDGVTGRYFHGTREAEPDRQANDLEARRRLRELSDQLCER
jgi:NAD(P)-dependent dehydrogenase (short-subunit alcohol dehydrogenase family)